jgi:hypothetical protein
MQLVSNYSKVLFVLSCIIKFCSCKDNNNDYFIETSPYTLCTVHLKTFATSFSDMNIFRKIVNANQNGNIIWTIWNGYANTTVKPLINFQERCTANMVFDQQKDEYWPEQVLVYMKIQLDGYRYEYRHLICS